jgi:hypothetical protein
VITEGVHFYEIPRTVLFSSGGNVKGFSCSGMRRNQKGKTLRLFLDRKQNVRKGKKNRWKSNRKTEFQEAVLMPFGTAVCGENCMEICEEAAFQRRLI